MAATPTEIMSDETPEIEFHLWVLISADGSWEPVLLPGLEPRVPPSDPDAGERVSWVASMYAPVDANHKVVIDEIMERARARDGRS